MGQFCVTTLNLDQQFRRCYLKTFHILSSGGPFVQHREPFVQFLLEDIIRNNSVKLFCIWTSGSDVVLSRVLATPLFGQAEPFVQFW